MPATASLSVDPAWSEVCAVVTALTSSPSSVPVAQVISDRAVDALRRATAQNLQASVDLHVQRHGLAFITSAGLQYQESVEEGASLSPTSTAVVQGLERSSAFFTYLAEQAPGWGFSRASFSAYISTPGSTKLGPHDDMWDNVVFQLEGEKVFSILRWPGSCTVARCSPLDPVGRHA